MAEVATRAAAATAAAEGQASEQRAQTDAARRKEANLFRKRMHQDYYAWWTGGRFD